MSNKLVLINGSPVLSKNFYGTFPFDILKIFLEERWNNRIKIVQKKLIVL